MINAMTPQAIAPDTRSASIARKRVKALLEELRAVRTDAQLQDVSIRLRAAVRELKVAERAAGRRQAA
jgi:hypothetical protein